MALIGREGVRISAPWLQVTQAVVPVGSEDPDHGGTIVLGENREMKHDKPPEIYTITAPVLLGGDSSVRRVISALTAQGYQIAEHKEREWLLELVNTSAPEEVGDSDAVSVARPAVYQMFDRLQAWIDRRKQRRGG
jgi:hypothetical protein